MRGRAGENGGDADTTSHPRRWPCSTSTEPQVARLREGATTSTGKLRTEKCSVATAHQSANTTLRRPLRSVSLRSGRRQEAGATTRAKSESGNASRTNLSFRCDGLCVDRASERPFSARYCKGAADEKGFECTMGTRSGATRAPMTRMQTACASAVRSRLASHFRTRSLIAELGTTRM